MGTITYNVPRTNPTNIYRATGGGVTFSANLTGVAVFDYFADAPAVNDALYFGAGYGGDFSNLYFNIGTAMAGTDIVLAWEYWCATTTSWAACHDLTDGTVGFTAAGAQTVTFPIQAGANYNVTVNGVTSRYWVRCRIVSFTTVTEGGANQTTAAKKSDGIVLISGYTDGSPCTLALVYAACAAWPEIGASKLGADTYSFPNCRFNMASRLRSYGENLYLGNGSAGGIVQLDYWHGGTASGTDGWIPVDVSNIFLCYWSTGFWTYSYANAKQYGGCIYPYRAYVAGATRSFGGYGSEVEAGTWIGVNFYALNGMQAGVFRKCSTAGPIGLGIYGAVGATIDRLSIFYSSSTYLTLYGYAYTLSDLIYTMKTSGQFNQLANYSRALDWVYVNTLLPRMADPFKPIARVLSGAVAVVSYCFVYDASLGTFTDYTAQAQSVAVDDVPMGGDAGDCVYLNFNANVSIYYTPQIEFTITPQANGYAYVSEYYDGSWKTCPKTWDSTANFTTSGWFYPAIPNWTPVAINGVTGFWFRLRIAAGAGAPTASRIRSQAIAGVAQWNVYEKHNFDLTVRDTAGSPIVGAAVVITDSDGVVQYSGATGAGGVMVMQTLTAAKWWFDPLDPASSGSPQYICEKIYLAYAISVSAPGYRTSTNHVTLTAKTALTMPLEQNLGHSAVM